MHWIYAEEKMRIKRKKIILRCFKNNEKDKEEYNTDEKTVFIILAFSLSFCLTNQ